MQQYDPSSALIVHTEQPSNTTLMLIFDSNIQKKHSQYKGIEIQDLQVGLWQDLCPRDHYNNNPVKHLTMETALFKSNELEEISEFSEE